MIISASRRTDIPAFYSDWFFNRLKEGYVLVKNPMNPHQISKIDLSPSVVDCIVFWTKNPKPMLDRLEQLNAYNHYFQFTLNPYDTSMEPGVPKKRELIETFMELSRKIGKNRVVWRYDPIILTDVFTKAYHYKWFEYLAASLCAYTCKCVFSFADRYKKTERNMKNIRYVPITDDDMHEVTAGLAEIASRYGLTLETCSESIDLEKYNIKHGKCIDDRLISDLMGVKLNIAKDPNQRESCGCVRSIDIGAYDTCRHGCCYCYANYSRERVAKNMECYDSHSPLLCDVIGVKDSIKEREMRSCVKQ